MVSASQIREIARNYLADVIGLQDFADTFEAQYSDLDEAREFEALALADQIQTLLIRVSEGYSVEADLREALRPLIFGTSPVMGRESESPLRVERNPTQMQHLSYTAVKGWKVHLLGGQVIKGLAQRFECSSGWVQFYKGAEVCAAFNSSIVSHVIPEEEA